jgi:anti-sigma-K factor RskA
MNDRPQNDAGHERHGESVAAYLLGALPDLEAQAFERHLMGCERCRDELEQLRPAVEALPHAPIPVQPPPSLKASLMETVRSEAQGDARPGLVSRLGERIRARTALRPLPAMAWVSAVLILGFVGGVGASGLLGGNEDPAIYTASVSSSVSQGSASLEVDPDGGHGAVMSVSGMPTLPSAQQKAVYQLWLVRGDDNPAPSSTFSVGADGTGRGAITENMRGVDAVLVTREPAGGSKVPSEEPIISVELG